MTNEIEGSDDCLYLNVYRPTSTALKKCAVMVWIHGGGFVAGSGNDTFYGPDYLIRKDIVLVTINYRLGVLGFLNVDHEVASGNQGLKDQVMALRWIKENISSFGGDPDNVTIFGESAGSASVHYLTISPLAEGLFHKAIAQSGVAVNPWALATMDPKERVYQLAAKLGEHSIEPEVVVEFLKTIDATKLVATERELFTPLQRHVEFGVFLPSIDDKSPNPFMPQHPSVMMQKGVQVPLMIGFNSNEGSMFLSPFRQNDTEYLVATSENFEVVMPLELRTQVKKHGITPKDVKRLYFGDKPVCEETIQEYADYISDALLLQGIYDVIDIQVEKATQPTYFYKFVLDIDTWTKLAFHITLPGASHGDDLEFLFYPYMAQKFNLAAPEPGTDKYQVMEYFTTMWTNFAKTGNPTPKITDLIPTKWKPIEKSNTSYLYLKIDRTLEMESSSKAADRCRFDWDKRLKRKL
ncbi:cholinesterase 1-like [Ceratina calcarata]|uniref:Carboxylic ester hydrolase n=1 Tax=Ceratina calcarata TaxID=156304 RepID=A0AAJ7J1I2_9HYME|nr:cholinesterase 1-like [Ceratina calcarata]